MRNETRENTTVERSSNRQKLAGPKRKFTLGGGPSSVWGGGCGGCGGVKFHLSIGSSFAIPSTSVGLSIATSRASISLSCSPSLPSSQRHFLHFRDQHNNHEWFATWWLPSIPCHEREVIKRKSAYGYFIIKMIAV